MPDDFEKRQRKNSGERAGGRTRYQDGIDSVESQEIKKEFSSFVKSSGTSGTGKKTLNNQGSYSVPDGVPDGVPDDGKVAQKAQKLTRINTIPVCKMMWWRFSIRL